MKIAIFSTKDYDKPFFNQAVQGTPYELRYLPETLSITTAQLAEGCEVACCFPTDQLTHDTLKLLKKAGVNLIALRSSGFDHLDVEALHKLNLSATRVPSYSPNAIAEFAATLTLSLARKLTQTLDQVRKYNFALDHLVGMNLEGKTVGIIGTGYIGNVFAKIMHGFGCKLIAHDPYPNSTCKQLGVEYVPLTTLFKQADIISLHCPLTNETKHIINKESLALMKPSVILINTGRGSHIDTSAVIEALKQKKISGLAIDVYEKEKALFFADHSNEVIQDEQIKQLQSFPNVIITGHQAFFTDTALKNIADTTIKNIQSFEQGKLDNSISKEAYST